MSAGAARDYEEIRRKVTAALPAGADRQGRMQVVADALWAELRDSGVSWAGFYVHAGGEELQLGPRQPKPACSPIGLHGACGQCFKSGRPVVVRDVRELGPNYIACDPRDLSEVVLPLLEADGRCWGVLDLDSHAVGSFGAADVAGLASVLRAAGLTT